MSEGDGQQLLRLRERAALALTTEPTESLTSLLQDIISVSCPLEDKYREMDVVNLLQHNLTGTSDRGLTAISTAFNILEKYGRNLLSPHKPKFWRAVKFNNPVFKTTVDGIQGGRAILCLYGYTVEQSDGMSFPEEVREPDRGRVAAVTVEVAMLQTELEQLRKGMHPHPELFSRFLPAGRLASQGGHQQQSVEEITSASNSEPQEASQTGAVTASPAWSGVESPSAALSPPETTGGVQGEELGTPDPPIDVGTHSKQAAPVTSCAVCSRGNPAVHCLNCSFSLCEECDRLYHRHPDRGGHHRMPLWNGRPEPPVAAQPSDGSDGHSPRAPTPPAAGPSLDGAVPPPTVECPRPAGLGWEPEEEEEEEEEEETTRRRSGRPQRPGLGRRSLSADQQHPFRGPAPRAERRLSDLAARGLPRPPWTCAGCRQPNEGRAVLCGGCERPRASRAPGEGGRGPGPGPRGRWCCQACTCQNEASSVLCSACDRPRLAGRPSFSLGQGTAPVVVPPPPPTHQAVGWECQHCTFWNLHPGRICAMCDRTSTRGQPPAGTPRPKVQKLEERPRAPGEEGGPGAPQAAVVPPAAVSDRAADRARQENMRQAGLCLVNMIRLGEEKKVSPEEVFCALQCSGTDAPLQWLQTELPQLLEALADLASQEGEAMAEDQVGPVAQEEARQAWLACGGNFEEAVSDCVRERTKKFRAIRAMGFTDRGEVLQALYMNAGNVDKAVIDLQRKLLEPFHTQIWQEDEEPIQLDQVDKPRMLRQILATYNLPSWGRAEIVLSLMQEGRDHYQLQDVVEAVKESQDKEFIKRMLSLSCLVCLSLFPRSKMQSLTSCECTICRDCFKDYFTFTVREKHIKSLVCPGCSKPDIDDEGHLLSYFSTLDVQLRDCLDVNVYNLFHKKLTERTLMKDPKFKWCTHCSNGFIYDGNQSKVTCPQCKGSFCVECKRPWEQQHQGISCEDFQNWKRENDPEYQAQGLAAYLKENGIDCPNCKFRYALAKGGCMHFKCSQCQHEFCSGCYNTFLATNKCNDPVCQLKKGLHAHHPRDCLFYLRDWSVLRLQTLLQNSKVNFDIEPPTGAKPTPGGVCRVMQQREVGDHLSDELCGVPAQDGHAGLCEIHYKEYLVSRINAHSLDPAQLFEEGEMDVCLKRCGKIHQPKGAGEDEATYRNRMLQVIATIPLGDKVPRVKK